MTAILLSDAVSYRTANVRLMDFGGFNRPALGGAIQRINRQGNRYVLEVELPPIPEEPTGRIFSTLWEQALSAGALYAFPEPGLVKPAYGTPLVNGAHTGGTSLIIKGLSPSVTIKQGKFLSIIHSGRRYLYRNSANAVASVAGAVTLTLTTQLREDLSNNDVIELQTPIIEGWVESPSWGIMLEPYAEVSRFSITEAS